MKPSKLQGTKDRTPSSYLVTLHQRLYEALNLGINYINRIDDKKVRRWQCSNAEILVHVARLISSFVGCISSQLLRHPLVKNSMVDIMLALECILWSGNEAALTMATGATEKLIDILGNAVLQYDALVLVAPLARLLSSRKLSVAVSSAICMDHILSKPTSRERHKKIWNEMIEMNVVGNVICAIQEYLDGSQAVELFKAMFSLLRTILWQWPPSRFSIYHNIKFFAGLEALIPGIEISFIPRVLQLYSALALCGNCAMKLLERRTIFSMMVSLMKHSQPYHVQKEAFILFQYLSRSEEGCSKIIQMSGRSIVKRIIGGMSGWRSFSSTKVPAQGISVLLESCRAALITRWPGGHHFFFWKLGIDQVLLDLLLSNSDKINLSLVKGHPDEMILAVTESFLATNSLHFIRPYIWDILGFLVIQCPSDLYNDVHGDLHYLNILIACACVLAVRNIQGGLFADKEFPHACECEPISRAVLLMVYSPCKYIASQSRKFLSEMLMRTEEKYILQLLESLKSAVTSSALAIADNSQVVLNLISITYCLSFAPYFDLFSGHDITKVIVACLMKSVSCEWQVTRPSIAPHMKDESSTQTCCWEYTEDWVGGNLVLFFSLWALHELIQERHPNSGSIVKDLKNSGVQNLFSTLNEAYSGSSSPGIQWFVVCILCFFGRYGFPCSYGERIKRALRGCELSDLKFILSDGQHVRAHKPILMVRCPLLLPPNGLKDGSEIDNSFTETDVDGREFTQDIPLNYRVGYEALMKVLEFAYGGFIEADDILVKQLKLLSRHCNMHSLSDMLHKRRPKWGDTIPRLDLRPARKSDVHLLDIILESKPVKDISWSCNLCFMESPHEHVHKVILSLNCDYLKALFQSGTRDSQSRTIKVPIGQKALSNLVHWFYTGELPEFHQDCSWNNMDTEEKLFQLQSCVELCWLSQFWLLEGIYEVCLENVLQCLQSDTILSLRIIQMAAQLAQWNIVETAVRTIAPHYPHIRKSGDLEIIDEGLCDMVRAAYVHLSQEGNQL